MIFATTSIFVGILGLADPADPQREAQCVAAAARPTYEGFGWAHHVDVVNECTFDVQCEVSTTVDPSPTYDVVLRPDEMVRVRTRAGSPTFLYQPIVRCQSSP